MQQSEQTHSGAEEASSLELGGDLIQQEDLPIELPAMLPDEHERAMQFVHSSFASITLPRSAVTERYYEHHYSYAAIRIEAGTLFNGDEFEEQCIPFGSTARMINLYIATYARQKNTREVSLGDSMCAFVQTIRGRATGGENGTIKAVVKQIKAIAACKMTVGVRIQQYGGQAVNRTTKIQFAGAFEGGFNQQNWPQSIILDDDYFESLRQHSLPLDLRAVQMVSNSAMAMDLLMFLAHRLPRVKEGGEMLAWPQLLGQFGGRGMDPKSFKRFIVAQLKNVVGAYPDARIEVVPGGLFMRKSKPLVPKVSVLIPSAPGLPRPMSMRRLVRGAA